MASILWDHEGPLMVYDMHARPINMIVLVLSGLT